MTHRIFTRLIVLLGLLALCACGQEEFQSPPDGDGESERAEPEFEYAAADAAWLSKDEQEKATGEVGELCSPNSYTARDCRSGEDVTYSEESGGCSGDRTQRLLCQKNAAGEWRNALAEGCAAYSLCVMWSSETSWDCLPDYGGYYGSQYSACQAVCQPGQPPCILSYSSVVAATDVTENCQAEKEAAATDCATKKGRLLADGEALPGPTATCPIEILQPYLRGIRFDRGVCNRCVVAGRMILSCDEGNWRSERIEASR